MIQAVLLRSSLPTLTALGLFWWLVVPELRIEQRYLPPLAAVSSTIMALSAVGNRKVCVTPWRWTSSKAVCGEKRPLCATIGRPKYSVGSRASISPPVQAQSAGDQNTASL